MSNRDQFDDAGDNFPFGANLRSGEFRDRRPESDFTGKHPGFLSSTESDEDTRIKDFLSSTELAFSDECTEYLVEDVLPLGEPGCIAAKSKSLKTTIAIDLAVSVATGRKFLGRFEVKQTGNVGIISGESGLAALKETASRICHSKGMELSDLGTKVQWSTKVPRLPGDIDLVREVIREGKLKLLILDPTYFLLRDIAGDLANATKVGSALEPLTEVCRETHCTILLVAHNRKGRALDTPRHNPPGLEEIAGAGLDQWVRYWVLLGPKQDFDSETGSHKLWLVTGGSSGHAGYYAINVHEGTRRDPGGRVWKVEVESASQARSRDEREKEKKKIDAQQYKRDEHVQRVREAVKLHPGQSKKYLRGETGLTSAPFDEAMKTLEGGAEVESKRETKGHNPCQTYWPTDKIRGGAAKRNVPDSVDQEG